jgi:hypothetical protein
MYGTSPGRRLRGWESSLLICRSGPLVKVGCLLDSHLISLSGGHVFATRPFQGLGTSPRPLSDA